MFIIYAGLLISLLGICSYVIRPNISMEEHNIFDSIQLAICVVLLLAGIAISVTGIAFWYEAIHPDIKEVRDPDGS